MCAVDLNNTEINFILTASILNGFAQNWRKKLT